MEGAGIRRATYTTTAAILLCLALAGSTSATRPNIPGWHVPPAGCLDGFTQASKFRLWAKEVWNPDRWERGKPKGETIAAAHRWIACAGGPGHAKAMKKRWRESRDDFLDLRRRELFRARVTPYPGGGRWWAIPFYIVDCESGGDYGAQNPTSSARGAYQMLDTTYAAYCVACDWSKRDQDLAAHRLYQEAGASPWVCG